MDATSPSPPFVRSPSRSNAGKESGVRLPTTEEEEAFLCGGMGGKEKGVMDGPSWT